jgi:sugar phosphate isomerase/epimerase
MTTSALSVQLYTVREALRADTRGTLQRLADIGYTQVEPFNIGLPGLGDALVNAGLTASTAHAHVIGESIEDQAAVFEAARSLGIGTVIDPLVKPEHWQTVEQVAETAARVNASAEIAADLGIRFGYHNHAHEVRSLIGERTALEAFAEQLDTDVVLEVDTYWVTVGGVDPVGLLTRLGDRVVAIHVKDGPGTADPRDQVAVGKGSLPIGEIIAAAPDALRVVELDDSRADRFQAVADSYTYLTTEGLA